MSTFTRFPRHKSPPLFLLSNSNSSFFGGRIPRPQLSSTSLAFRNIRTGTQQFTNTSEPIPPTYFPPPPPLKLWQKPIYQYRSASKFHKARYWINAMVFTATIYIVYRNIEIVPEMGHKRFNCISQRREVKNSTFKFIRTCNLLTGIQNEGLDPYVKWEDERAKRVWRLVQQILISNGMNPTKWYIAMINVPGE